MGYATSAQALELLAQDWKETYEKRAEEVRMQARKDEFNTKLCAAIAVGAGYSAIKEALAGNTPWWATGMLGVMASANAYFSLEAHRGVRTNDRIGGEIKEIVANWGQRDQLHPIKAVQQPNDPKGPFISRWVGKRSAGYAKPLVAYDTIEQLMANTDESKLGLVNGVVAHHLMPIREILPDRAERIVHFGLAIPELQIQWSGLFPNQIDHVLLIGQNKEGQYCHHYAMHAITTDTYYSGRQPKTKAAEVSKGLLWTPTPVRA